MKAFLPNTLLWRRLALAAVVTLLALSVYFLNGVALFYFDTAGYLKQGYSILQSLGVGRESLDIAGQVAGEASSSDHTVIASRSAAYGLLVAVFNYLGVLDGAVVLNLCLIWLSTLITARQLVHDGNGGRRAFNVAAAGMIAASGAALPFYVALLMPDILAPILILMLATLCTSAQRMGRIDLLLSVGLAVIAIVTHPSHLVMAALILPAGLLLSPAMAGRRLWLSLALAVLLVGVGVAERLAFSLVVERLQQKQALYLPFLTARLIDDGPALTYLHAHCPDATITTCKLYDALSESSHPERLDAPNILFATSPELGSYKHLSESDQQAVAGQQFEFIFSVIKAAPFSTFAALAGNVATQLRYYRIDMTIPRSGRLEGLRSDYGPIISQLREGRLVTANRSWMEPLAYVHGAIYILSGMVLMLFLLLGGLPPANRALTVLVFYGILVNALVCGGVSEPAYRYGARVMFLLPMLAAMLWAAQRIQGRIKEGDWASAPSASNHSYSARSDAPARKK